MGQDSLTKRRPKGVRDADELAKQASRSVLTTGDFYDIPFEIMQLEKDIEEALHDIIKKRERLKYLKSLTLKVD